MQCSRTLPCILFPAGDFCHCVCDSVRPVSNKHPFRIIEILNILNVFYILDGVADNGSHLACAYCLYCEYPRIDNCHVGYFMLILFNPDMKHSAHMQMEFN